MATHPYTLRDAEKLLGVSRVALRELIRHGYVPDTRRGREYRLSFQDIVMLKAARELLAARISPRRIGRSLARLRATRPPVATPLRLAPVGSEVTLAGDEQLHSVESGQLLLDFGHAAGDAAALFAFRVPEGAARGGPDAAGADVGPTTVVLAQPIDLTAPPGTADAPANPRPADYWLLRGSSLEATRPGDAVAAYRQAIQADARFTAAYVNLGIVLSEQRRLDEAREVLQQAVAHCAPEPVLHFNLGTVLEDMNDVAAAIAEYEQALRIDPRLADAHYNLGRLHERLGHEQLAIRHYSRYRKLDRDGR